MPCNNSLIFGSDIVAKQENVNNENRFKKIDFLLDINSNWFKWLLLYLNTKPCQKIARQGHMWQGAYLSFVCTYICRAIQSQNDLKE